MKGWLQLFYWGMLISFLGSLPPGIINIVPSQISGKHGTGAAMAYAVGSMLAEVIVVRIALSGMNAIIRSRHFFRILEWITATMLVFFAVFCFIQADPARETSQPLPGTGWPPFVTGVVLSAINPLHIPFWIGWSTLLMNKEVLLPQHRHYNIYAAGIAAGTMAGFTVFIFCGAYLLKAFQSNQYLINCMAGTGLFAAAFLHIRKMIFVPAAARHARLFRRS
jgi:threonine/homoserine/homoserine lactone efflux protein